MVYKFIAPTNATPREPPIMPTYENAEGVAKIPIPTKTLNMLKLV